MSWYCHPAIVYNPAGFGKDHPAFQNFTEKVSLIFCADGNKIFPG